MSIFTDLSRRICNAFDRWGVVGVALGCVTGIGEGCCTIGVWGCAAGVVGVGVWTTDVGVCITSSWAVGCWGISVFGVHDARNKHMKTMISIADSFMLSL